jgi:Zn-dependent M28 family amino/carboxypeptidase
MRKAALLTLAIAGVLVGPSAATAAPSATDTSALRNAVTVNGIMKHEKALQQIANANGGTRASGTPGFDASRDYVAAKLRAAGYQVTIQPFNFDFFTELSPPVFERVSPDPKTYALGTEFQSMEYSGSGDVTGTVVPAGGIVIPPGAKASTSASGCDDSDFDPAVGTQVALIQRGTCDFVVKARNAQAKGYSAAIIFNEGQPGRTDVINGTLGATDVTIPVLDTSFAVGAELYDLTTPGPVTVHIVTNTTSETRSTSNVIADLNGGRTDRTVVVGAHLDSVPEGPGINDDGSGTATDLEVALQMAKTKTTNHVRFLWFGAEEAGLIGSQRYVASLTNQQQHDIMAMLDFDMLASPNFVRFVYDGDGSEPDNPAGPSGSGMIEDVFNSFWNSQGMDTEPTAFDGRSDYDSFTAVGIPAGGIFAGAEGIKTAEEALIYGGTAGEPYDECYHLACDTLKNLNLTALDQFSDAVAHSTLTFAQTQSNVNGTEIGSSTTSENKGHFKVR